MRSLPRRFLLGFAVVALCAVPAAEAKVAAGSKTVTKGDLSATLSWNESDFTTADGGHLKVTLGDTIVLDEDLSKECELCGSLGDPQHAVSIRDLDADGNPEVLVDTFSGGAHCCYGSIVVSPQADGDRTTVQYWGNGGYVLKQLNGIGGPEFVTTDDRFAYAFTSYVASWRPPMIDEWVNGTFEDHTRAFLGRVRADIRAIDKELPKIGDYDARGAIGARAADMALLGISADGIHRWLERAKAKGYARGPSGYPRGEKCIARIEKYLRQWGYLRSSAY